MLFIVFVWGMLTLTGVGIGVGVVSDVGTYVGIVTGSGAGFETGVSTVSGTTTGTIVGIDTGAETGLIVLLVKSESGTEQPVINRQKTANENATNDLFIALFILI